MPSDLPIVVSGAGLAGCAFATAMAHHGHKVLVVERQPQLQTIGSGISIWPNALAALDQIGLGEAAQQAGIVAPLKGVLDSSGRTIREFTPERFEKALGGGILGVNRGRLLDVLASPLPPDAFIFGRSAIGYQHANSVTGQNGVTVNLDDGSKVQAAALIAADGVNSAIASQLDPKLKTKFAGYIGWRGIAQIPSDKVRGSQIWGEGREAGFLPVSANEVYWFVTEPAANNSAPPAEPIAHILKRFAHWPEPVADLVRATPPETLLRHPINDRQTLRQWSDKNVIAVGDAAHPMRPHLGQGGCQAIIDGVALAHRLHVASQTGVLSSGQFAQTFREFERARRRAVKPIVLISAQIGRTLHSPLPVAAASRMLVSKAPQKLMLIQFAQTASRSAGLKQLVL